MVERVPPEVFQTIFLNLGGQDFVNLRSTCKRWKIIADDLEMRLKPGLWYRYTHGEFPSEVIESVIPWLRWKIQRFENDNYLWKSVYCAIVNSKKVFQSFMKEETDIPYKTSELHNVFFVGQQLLIDDMEHILALVIREKRSSKFMKPITMLPNYEDKTSVKYFEPSLSKKLSFRPFNIDDQKSPLVESCRQHMSLVQVSPLVGLQAGIWKATRNTFREAHTRTMDYGRKRGCGTWDHEAHEDGIMVLTSKEKLVFCHYDEPNELTEYFLSEDVAPGHILKLQRVGRMLIIVVFQKGIFVNQMEVDEKSNKIVLGPWKLLSLGRPLDHGVVGIELAGYALIALTSYGNIYMTNVVEQTHEHMEKYLRPAYELEHRLKSPWLKLCADSNNGLVICCVDSAGNVVLLYAK